MDVIQSPKRQEFRQFTKHLTYGIVPVTLPGPTRLSEAEVKKFKCTNPEGTHELSVMEAKIYFRNRVVRGLMSPLFKPYTDISIRLDQFDDPAESRFYAVEGYGEDVKVIQDHARPRHANEADIAALNSFLSSTATNTHDI